MINLQKWQAKLNNRESRKEVTKEEERQLKADRILAIFGCSDDLIEFRGLIDDEFDCYFRREGNGFSLYINVAEEIIVDPENLEDLEIDYLKKAFEESIKNLPEVKIAFDGQEGWKISVYNYPLEKVATCKIIEDGEPYGDLVLIQF